MLWEHHIHKGCWVGNHTCQKSTNKDAHQGEYYRCANQTLTKDHLDHSNGHEQNTDRKEEPRGRSRKGDPSQRAGAEQALKTLPSGALKKQNASQPMIRQSSSTEDSLKTRVPKDTGTQTHTAALSTLTRTGKCTKWHGQMNGERGAAPKIQNMPGPDKGRI